MGRGTPKGWRGLNSGTEKKAEANPSSPSVSSATPPIHLPIAWGGKKNPAPSPARGFCL